MQRYLAHYYRRVLDTWPLEELFGDLTDDPAWRAAAHRELGDLFAYRNLTPLALRAYARALAAAPTSHHTWRALARALTRTALHRSSA
jgi:hypothetical protein